MTIVSLFCGAGGLDLGLIQAGNRVIRANDNAHDAVETYRTNVGGHVVEDDVRRISQKERGILSPGYDYKLMA